MTDSPSTDRTYIDQEATLAEFKFGVIGMPQITRLLEIHEELGGSGPGRRRNLEALNKAAIVLISAYWEAFVEDLAAETLGHFAQEAKSVDNLPSELRKSVARELANDKHELAAWRLAGDGWRQILRERSRKIKDGDDRTLNAPTSQNVEDFFRIQAGILTITTCWRWPKAPVGRNREKLDGFIKLRNAIAHRGGPTDTSVLKRDARDGFDLIKRLAKQSLRYVNGRVEEFIGIPLVSPPEIVEL